MTDKEREAGDYSKRFTKGQVYRIKARSWKGDALYEPQWYVTEVLEEGVSCPGTGGDLGGVHKAHSSGGRSAGNLTLDREMSYFKGTCQWMGKEVQISLDVEIEKKASWTRVTNVMKKLVDDQEAWDKVLAGDGCPKAYQLRPTSGWRTTTKRTGTLRKTPSPRMSLPIASFSLSLQYLRAGALPPGMKTTICSGAM